MHIKKILIEKILKLFHNTLRLDNYVNSATICRVILGYEVNKLEKKYSDKIPNSQ